MSPGTAEEQSLLLFCTNNKKQQTSCNNTVDTLITESYGSSSLEGTQTQTTNKSRHHPIRATTTGVFSLQNSKNGDHLTITDDGSLSTMHNNNPMSSSDYQQEFTFFTYTFQLPSARRLALVLSLYFNIAITCAKFIAYVNTFSLSVLAALLDSVLDVVSQIVLNYTEQHSSMQRSSAFYPAGASRLEPIGVLTCAALMGMASFEVVKESITALCYHSEFEIQPHISSVYAMIAIVVIKLLLLWLCHVGAFKRQQRSITTKAESTAKSTTNVVYDEVVSKQPPDLQWADPTLEALAQDHWNDTLSNGVAAIALVLALHDQRLWFLDPIGAILISIYIIYSWYMKGKEQIEHLTGKSAPGDFIGELIELANEFDDRIVVDTVRAYHFGPKFLVEIEIVMHESTLLFESHDLGMDLQYAIEGREEVERCFVHIDYQARPYDEHVVSKVPELREKYVKGASSRTFRSTQSV